MKLKLKSKEDLILDIRFEEKAMRLREFLEIYTLFKDNDINISGFLIETVSISGELKKELVYLIEIDDGYFRTYSEIYFIVLESVMPNDWKMIGQDEGFDVTNDELYSYLESKKSFYTCFFGDWNRIGSIETLLYCVYEFRTTERLLYEIPLYCKVQLNTGKYCEVKGVFIGAIGYVINVEWPFHTIQFEDDGIGNKVKNTIVVERYEIILLE